jgi:hypothetical protein
LAGRDARPTGRPQPISVERASVPAIMLILVKGQVGMVLPSGISPQSLAER